MAARWRDSGPFDGSTNERKDRVNASLQAEIEYFVHPEKKAHPKFAGLASLPLQLFPSAKQLAAEAPVVKTLGDAVSEGMVANETLGFFIGRTCAEIAPRSCRDRVRDRVGS